MQNRKHKQTIYAAVLTGLVFCLIGAAFPFVYSLNDDCMIQSIVAGKYLGRVASHAVYLKHPLSALLAGMSKLVPAVPWFGLFLCSVVALCTFLALQRLFSLFPSQIGKIVSALAVGGAFFSLWLGQYVMPHYTVIAAILGGTGVFLYVTAQKVSWESPVLLLGAFLLRAQVFYMLLPFLLVAVLWKIFQEEKIIARKTMQTILPSMGILVIGFSIFFLWDKIAYSSEAWEAYESYNKVRTEVYDYTGVPVYEGNEAFYQNLAMSETKVQLLLDYNNLVMGGNTTEDFAAIAQYANEKNYIGLTWKARLRNAYINYRYYTFTDSGMPYNVILLGCYLFLIALLLRNRRWKQCVPIVCCFGGRAVIWMVLLLKGRFPERIQISLFTIEILLLFGCIADFLYHWCKTENRQDVLEEGGQEIIDEKEHNSTAGRVFLADKAGFCIVGISLVIAMLVIGGKSIPSAWEKVHGQMEKNQEYFLVKEYMSNHPDAFYFLDVYSMVPYTENVFAGYQNGYENYMLMGGWMLGTPLLDEKMQDRGLSSVVEGCTTEDRVYIIMRNNRSFEAIESYFSSVCAGIQVSIIDTIDAGAEYGFYVYALRGNWQELRSDAE